MTYQGKVLNGVVVLDNGLTLPDGTAVRVEPIEAMGETGDELSFAADILKLAGIVTGLPPDLARNHDHYLYGLPKR